MVRAEQGRSSRLRESGRQVAVWVLVIICHLGFLMLFLRPATDDLDTTSLAKNDARVLKLRYLSQPRQPLLSTALPAPRPVARKPHLPQAVPSRQSITVSTVQHAADVPAPRSEMHVIPPEPVPSQSPGGVGTNSDGGFQDNLREAQHAAAVHGVPGSDKTFVPGIRFVDPMDQGVGAVARNAQRLFGIKSRQCIDVETWRSLRPQELSARHISPSDVDSEDEKYDCNAPPGLHF